MSRWLRWTLTPVVALQWALVLAGPALSVLACWLIWIVWRGGWPADRAEQQLNFLGTALVGCLFLIGVVLFRLAAGKLGSITASAGAAKLTIEGDDDHGDH